MYRDTDKVEKLIPLIRTDAARKEFVMKQLRGRDDVIKILQDKIERLEHNSAIKDNIIEQLETVRL